MLLPKSTKPTTGRRRPFIWLPADQEPRTVPLGKWGALRLLVSLLRRNLVTFMIGFAAALALVVALALLLLTRR